MFILEAALFRVGEGSRWLFQRKTLADPTLNLFAASSIC